MHVLRLARHLPPRWTAPLALPLDAARHDRVDDLLQRHGDVVSLVRDALDRLAEEPSDTAAHSIVDRYTRFLVRELRRIEAADPAHVRFAGGLDALVRSDVVELMDRPWNPGVIKRLEMALLDQLNRNLGSYARWTEEILRVVQDLPSPRLCDLAAGSGGLARHLAKRRPRPDLELTSTDLEPEFVEAGRRIAQRDKLPVRFEVRDATQLRDLHGQVDLFVCTQATHHLPAWLLTRMFHQAVRAAQRGILVVDLLRSAGNVAGAWVVTNLTAPFPPLVIDGMQSIRRAWLPAELALLAHVAGAETVRTGVGSPAFTLLHAHGVRGG